ncbi:hypothetical protein WDW86_05305 [Bdellovibrionota bacterium FG-2]
MDPKNLISNSVASLALITLLSSAPTLAGNNTLSGKMLKPQKKLTAPKKLPSTSRGGETGGGGDAFICGDRVFLADTYKIINETERSRWQNFDPNSETMNASSVMAVALKSMRGSNPELSKKLAAYYAEFKFVVVKELEELDDDGIREIPKGCEKTQLAVQDLETGVIRYREDLYQNLSTLEQGLFRLHEAFIKNKTSEELRGKDTTEVRKHVDQIARGADGGWFMYLVERLAKGESKF